MDIHQFKGQKPMNPLDGESAIAPMIVDGEKIMSAYQGDCDMVVFTNIRIIAIKGKGMPGDKVYHLSFPYKNVTYFYWIMNSSFEGDCELHITLNPDMFVHIELKEKFDVKMFNELLAAYIK